MPDFNSRTPVFNKNVIQVYTEESGFTGYKGFDFTAIDEVENILKTEISTKASTLVNLLSGIADGSINVNQWNLSATDDSVTVSGDLRDTVLQIKDLVSGIADGSINVNQWNLSSVDDSVKVEGPLLNLVSGMAVNGVNVNQIDLDWEADSVSVQGPLLNFVSGIATNGVNVNQIDLDWEADSVSVQGPLLNFVSGIATNGVNVNQIDLDWEADSVSLSGRVADILIGSLVTGESLPSGLTVYQANLNKDLDDVTVYPEKHSNISNYIPSGNLIGTVLNGNADRKELYIQNLATGRLYVKYGPLASSGSFNFVLAANTAEDAGDGGSLSDQSYTGIVSVSGVNQFKYISWERS